MGPFAGAARVAIIIDKTARAACCSDDERSLCAARIQSNRIDLRLTVAAVAAVAAVAVAAAAVYLRLAARKYVGDYFERISLAAKSQPRSRVGLRMTTVYDWRGAGRTRPRDTQRSTDRTAAIFNEALVAIDYH